MLKRRILMVLLILWISSLAMTVHSADVKKIKPGDIRQVPQVTKTPTKIDTGNIQRPKSDLSITAMQIFPANPKKGDTVRFTARVINMGLAASTATQAGIRVGGESNPQLFPVPALAPNAIHTITRHQMMTTPGHFRVTFIADANGNVAESNENNNSKYKNFTVKDILPDLTVVNPRVIPANPTVNDQIRLTATLKNVGDIPAGSFKTGVRIGGESQPKLAGSVDRLEVTTPQSQQYVVSRLWNTSRPGKYVVEFYVDVDDDVKELNEHNNKISFVITVGP